MSTVTSHLLPKPTSKPYPFPGIPIPDVPDIADRNCKLLGPFAISVQLIMGFVVLGTLVLKRQKEKPKRPWKIWTLDISKQMLGQLFVHTLNVLLSSLGSLASEGANNPCSLYFLNIGIDTTIGVLFIYFSMRFLTHYFTDVLGWPGFVSGQYTSVPTIIGRRRRSRRTNEASFDDSVLSPSISETQYTPIHESRAQNALSNIQDAITVSERDPSAVAVVPIPTSSTILNNKRQQRPRLRFFFRQLSLYLLSLLLMKIMVVILFALFPFLYNIGRWVLNLFGPHQKAQIFFVMAAFPLAMNTLQFWLIDSLLRHNPLTSIYRNDEEAEAAVTDVGNGGGETGNLRDGTNESTEQGQARKSWWVRGDPTSSYHRDDSQSRLMSDHDHDDSSRDEEHIYPPTSSATSSLAQLDAQNRASTIEAVLDESNAQGQMNDKAIEGTLASITTTDTKSENTVEANNEEDDDAWDNWNEDSKTVEQKRPET